MNKLTSGKFSTGRKNQARCAIYAQAFTPGLPPVRQQIAACRRLVSRLSYSLLDKHIVSDQRVSLFPWAGRRGLEKLLTAVEEQPKGFDVLVVYSLSCLNRNEEALRKVLGAFEFYGVQVIAVCGACPNEDCT